METLISVILGVLNVGVYYVAYWMYFSNKEAFNLIGTILFFTGTVLLQIMILCATLEIENENISKESTFFNFENILREFLQLPVGFVAIIAFLLVSMIVLGLRLYGELKTK